MDRNVWGVSECAAFGVALRKESVDRNSNYGRIHNVEIVALRKESVDRNFGLLRTSASLFVALRKESVDRNKGFEVQA